MSILFQTHVTRPEVELGNTCHIVVLPNPKVITEDVFSVYMMLEVYCIAAYIREDETGKEIRLFVVPATLSPADWEQIEQAFGTIRYVTKIH